MWFYTWDDHTSIISSVVIVIDDHLLIKSPKTGYIGMAKKAKRKKNHTIVRGRNHPAILYSKDIVVNYGLW